MGYFIRESDLFIFTFILLHLFGPRSDTPENKYERFNLFGSGVSVVIVGGGEEDS
jgi:hypothetical protein